MINVISHLKYMRYLVLILTMLSLQTQAAIPNSIDYQGYLTDSSGAPLTNTVSINFLLYSAATGGTPVWSETQLVTVTKGLFKVKLGTGTALPAVLFDNPIWLGINVAGDGEMSPRNELSSAPYALNSGNAETLGGNDVSIFATVDALTLQGMNVTALETRLTDSENAIVALQSQVATPSCIPGDFFNCYSGTAGTAGTGVCQSGIRTCGGSGVFGICENEVIPQTEICDGLDNNCDGQADEGNICAIVDQDGDGFAPSQGDCNDDDIMINPGALDNPDDFYLDRNCDGIDGELTKLLFVAATGNDGNPGTRVAPFATISAALLAASANASITGIAVSDGTYNERIELVDGKSIYGGYLSGSNWTRAIAPLPRITGEYISGRREALIADSITTATTIEFLELLTPNVTTSGDSNYGARISNSTALVMRRLNINVGNGANAASGTNGSAGANGIDGANGGNAVSGSSGGGGGGAGGNFSCGAETTSGGAGGDGGYDTGAGMNGIGGFGNAAGLGGIGGNGGQDNGLTCSLGSSGSNGFSGQIATAGAAGAAGSNAAGSFVGNLWLGASGGAGQAGGNGSGGGGGGGGGGGASAAACIADRGAGGGGGGAGGCGGSGGTGGLAGGGSFGIVLSSSTVDISDTSILTGSGGSGGSGGGGAAGGTGGAGAFGGSPADDGRPGGNGGNGGSAGDGGGGGGGCGGASIGIAHIGASSSNRINVSITASTGGSGGAGGFPNASSGCNGTVIQVQSY